MKVLAVTTDGKLTYCTASPEDRSKGRCNHVSHQNEDESNGDFMKRVSEDLLKQALINQREEILSQKHAKKLDMVKNHENLDILVDDKNYQIRRAVAEQRYGLDKLINDEDWGIRIAVAEQGYGLERLVNDKSPYVRAVVAEQGYGLDKLVDDENWQVRRAVAQQGYGLDKLINDERHYVRAEVARQGYGLKKLINDKNKEVRDIASELLNRKRG